jgi:dTMP kinase
MKYSTVVFDLDGTVADTMPGILNAVRYALKKMNNPILPDEELAGFSGPPLGDSFQNICQMSKEESEKATLFFREYYDNIGWKESSLFPGVRSVITALKRADARLFVATGKKKDIAHKTLEHYFLDHFFEDMVAPEPGERFGDKEYALKKLLGNNMQGAVMIGDTVGDIVGAQKNGIASIAITYGAGSRQDLIDAKPDALIDSVDELYDLLGIQPMKGYFISLEGNDGSGKSTQAEMLALSLQKLGYTVLFTREPGGTPVSEKIRQLLLDVDNRSMTCRTEALLFAAGRAQHVEEVIKPALEQGYLVVCDRYVDSSIAYQGGGRELGIDLVTAINAPAIDGLLPDTTAFLAIAPDVALTRRVTATGADRIELSQMDFHNRVADAYQKIIQNDPDRFVIVNADQDIDSVQKELLNRVLPRLQAFEVQPCG